MKNVIKNLSKALPLISFARRSEVDKYLRMYKIDLESVEYRCAVCGEVITRDNIGIIISNGGHVKIVCSKPSCLAKINIYIPP